MTTDPFGCRLSSNAFQPPASKPNRFLLKFTQKLVKLQSYTSNDISMRLISVCIIFLLAAADTFGQSDKESIFQEAYQKYEKGQYRDAVAGFSGAIKIDSLFLEAFVFRGLANQALKSYRNALDDYLKAIAIAPKDTMLYLMKADLEAEIGESLPAIIDYSTAIALDPENAEIYRSRASQYYLLNHYILALEDYRKAISLDPVEATDFFSAGICLNMIEEYEDAIGFFSVAAMLEPEEPAIYYNRGISYSSAAMIAEACADWQKASDLGFEDARQLSDKYCKRTGR